MQVLLINMYVCYVPASYINFKFQQLNNLSLKSINKGEQINTYVKPLTPLELYLKKEQEVEVFYASAVPATATAN